MKETIFYLEGRGGMYLYHFFIYNLGGLYYIMNNVYNNRGKHNSSVLFDDISKITDIPHNISNPIKIHMKNVLPFQREAFDIIKDKFELIEDLSRIQDYEIVSIYGETCVKDDYSDNPTIIFPFLRNLFLERCNFKMIKGKRIYITRKLSESQHSGILRRYMLNENEFMENMKKYNVEFIQLENYNTLEKIKLFMESETIISTHSSCLTLLLFANKNCNIIEICNKGTIGTIQHNHYVNISNIIGLNYNKYSNIAEDDNGNFILNLDEFETFLNKII
jgi:hypothetical protein